MRSVSCSLILILAELIIYIFLVIKNLSFWGTEPATYLLHCRRNTTPLVFWQKNGDSDLCCCLLQLKMWFLPRAWCPARWETLMHCWGSSLVEKYYERYVIIMKWQGRKRGQWKIRWLQHLNYVQLESSKQVPPGHHIHLRLINNLVYECLLTNNWLISCDQER